MLTGTDIRNAIGKYVAALQDLLNREYARDFKSLVPPTIVVEYGVKYARIVKNDAGSSRSVHSFVALEGIDTKAISASPGDILKAASWKTPAPHARGSVFNENPLDGVGRHGANYLR